MHRALVAILACPRCRGDLALAAVRREQDTHILDGSLTCAACSQEYPIRGGVPRLLEAAADVQEVGRGFEYQWLARGRGRFEGKDRCYGFDHAEYLGWMRDRLAEQRPLVPGDRILDAGCGSGEKTHVLARMCPEQQVVGMDLGGAALEQAAAAFGDTPNLDFVQGNILSPPFQHGVFHWGISIGMLHHTPDTRRAFGQFRSLLAADAPLLIWIYPPYREAAEWHFLYFVRDALLLGQGHRLPAGLLRGLSFVLIVAVFPLAQLGWWWHGRRLSKRLPFFNVRTMSLRERFRALVFHLFDTLHPRYQHRHPRQEVEKWFREEGLRPIFAAHGYYVARPVAAPAPVVLV